MKTPKCPECGGANVRQYIKLTSKWLADEQRWESAAEAADNWPDESYHCVDCDWDTAEGENCDTKHDEPMMLSEPEPEPELKTFEVELLETVRYTVVVQVPSKDMAGDQAVEAWCASETPTEDYQGDGEGCEIGDITEVGHV